VKESTKKAVAAAVSDARAAASNRYKSIRASETGRMTTDAGIAVASGLASSFIEGAYPDASVSLGGMDVPYTALAGAAALVVPGASREVRAAGYGAAFSYGCSLAKQAGEDWANS
jgi:hypothetical protein